MPEIKMNTKDLIVHVARAGEDLSASLIKFASKWNSDQQFISLLSVNISTINNILLDIGKILEKNGNDLGVEDNVTRRLCESTNADFKDLAEALKRAGLKAGPGRFVGNRRAKFNASNTNGEFEFVKNAQGDAGTTGRDFLHNYPDGTALLKEELGNPFLAYRLQESKDHLWYLYEGFRFLALRRLEKEGDLAAYHTKELEKIIEQLPTVLAEMENLKKHILADDKMLKAVEDPHREHRQVELQPPINGPLARRTVDDDARSFVSVNSVASYQFLDANEVYEAWVIRAFEDEKWPRRTWSLGMFKVYEYFNTPRYDIEPQAMTLDQIKEQSEIVKAGEFKPEHTAIVESTLAKLPPRVQQEMKFVVEDRVTASLNSRFNRKWKIVDIIKKDQVQATFPVWMTLWRGAPAFSEALFIIKGETADKNDPVKPVRYEDAFRKPQYRRRYPREPIVHREYEHEILVNRRPPERRRQGSVGAGNRVSEIPEPPSLEEAESMILEILTAADKSHDDGDERLLSDEVII